MAWIYAEGYRAYDGAGNQLYILQQATTDDPGFYFWAGWHAAYEAYCGYAPGALPYLCWQGVEPPYWYWIYTLEAGTLPPRMGTDPTVWDATWFVIHDPSMPTDGSLPKFSERITYWQEHGAVIGPNIRWEPDYPVTLADFVNGWPFMPQPYTPSVNPGMEQSLMYQGNGFQFLWHMVNSAATVPVPWVKAGGTWQQAKETYVKSGGVWVPSAGLLGKADGAWNEGK